jgi:Domain of unknown function (DUF4412)
MGFFHCTGPRQSDNRPAMKLIPALVPLCALLLTSAVQASTFEGKVTMSVSTSDSKNPPQAINFSIKEGYVRTDVPTGKGTASMIFDMKNQQMIILIPQMQKYMVQSLAQNQASSAQHPAAGMPSSASNSSGTSFTDTGMKDTILGYECEKYLITTPKETSEMWLTDELGSFMGLYHGGAPGSRSTAPQEWETALKGKNFFPMRVLTKTSRGTSKMEITSVEKMSLPDSLFSPPDGWQKFDMGGIMSGLGGMFGGSHPQSGNN